MKPNNLVARSNVFDRIHRGTTFIVFMMAIVMYLFWVIASLISPDIQLNAGFCRNFGGQLGLTGIKQSGLTGLLGIVMIAGLFFGLNALTRYCCRFGRRWSVVLIFDRLGNIRIV